MKDIKSNKPQNIISVLLLTSVAIIAAIDTPHLTELHKLVQK